MTKEKFLALIRETTTGIGAYTWKLDQDGRICNYRGILLFDCFFDEEIDDEIIAAILNQHGHDSTIRRELLLACGL